jgi:co-chaperonin GroES (HSP10)
MKKITLLGNRVLVVPLRQAQTSSGGIHLPGAYQDDEKRYRVVAVGPGRKRKDGGFNRIECAPGDVVLIQPFHPHIIVDDKDGEVRIFDASAIELVICEKKEHIPVDTPEEAA